MTIDLIALPSLIVRSFRPACRFRTERRRLAGACRRSSTIEQFALKMQPILLSARADAAGRRLTLRMSDFLHPSRNVAHRARCALVAAGAAVLVDQAWVYARTRPVVAQMFRACSSCSRFDRDRHPGSGHTTARAQPRRCAVHVRFCTVVQDAGHGLRDLAGDGYTGANNIWIR
jgi:hypothetical protein